MKVWYSKVEAYSFIFGIKDCDFFSVIIRETSIYLSLNEKISRLIGSTLTRAQKDETIQDRRNGDVDGGPDTLVVGLLFLSSLWVS